MKPSPVFFALDKCDSSRSSRDVNQQLRNRMRTGRRCLAYVFGVLALAACVSQAPSAFGQIQSTTSCPAGQWDTLSVMMMDPGLAAANHMEAITNGVPTAYIYTIWDPSQTKLYYVKNPQGNPWDVNLYDANYIYQWVTELDEWDGVSHWNDPTSCKKFNNGSKASTSDFSMRWAARCVVPGGEGSSLWNSPPPAAVHNTNYFTYLDQVLQSPAQNLHYDILRVVPPSTAIIVDNRANPPVSFSITTLPLEYMYTCSVSGNINSCQFREIYDYGVDTDVNPVDNIKHSYGWVGWNYYTNSTGGDPNTAAVWVLANSAVTNQLMPGQVTLNFQCF
jgi:hypothetical protein